MSSLPLVDKGRAINAGVDKKNILETGILIKLILLGITPQNPPDSVVVTNL